MLLTVFVVVGSYRQQRFGSKYSENLALVAFRATRVDLKEKEMGPSNGQSWGYGQVGIFTLLMVIFFVWIFAGGGASLSSTRRDIKTTVHETGQDLKSTGRDMADSIRHIVH
jgi:hypothetical protein